MIDFNEQLSFYIEKMFNVNVLTAQAAQNNSHPLNVSSLFSKSMKLEARARRELLRSYGYQKLRGDRFHEAYSNQIDKTLEIIIENNLDEKYLNY